MASEGAACPSDLGALGGCPAAGAGLGVFIRFDRELVATSRPVVARDARVFVRRGPSARPCAWKATKNINFFTALVLLSLGTRLQFLSDWQPNPVLMKMRSREQRELEADWATVSGSTASRSLFLLPPACRKLRLVPPGPCLPTPRSRVFPRRGVESRRDSPTRGSRAKPFGGW
jgi:hypothetical protein